MDETQPLIQSTTSFFNSFFATVTSFETPLKSEKDMGTLLFIVNVFNGTVGIGLIMLLDVFINCGVILSSITFTLVFINILISTIYLFDSMARTSGAAAAMEIGGFPKNELGQMMFDFPRMLSFHLYAKGRIISFIVSISYLLSALWCSLSFCYLCISKIVKSFDVLEDINFDCSLISLITSYELNGKVCGSYYGISFGFMLIFVILSMINPKIFQKLQLLFFCYRIVALVLMFTTLIIFFSVTKRDEIIITSSSSTQDDWWLSLCKIGYMLSVSFFSFINCNTIIESTARSYTKRPFLYTLIVDITCFILYLSLSLMNTEFSKKTGILSDIWVEYTGIGDGWEPILPSDGSVVWAIIIKIIIMLLPIITTLSVYPPLVVFAAQTIYRYFNVQTFIIYHFWVDVIVRAGIASIPVFLCIFYNDSLTVLSFVGISATIIGVMIPSLIQFVSVKHVQRIFGEGMHKTIYTVKCLCSSVIAKFMVFIGIVDILFELLHFISSYFL
ncbi:hypothetical protein ENUP19_0259G0042 [Entamoeba nuttalli]|uniref:Amino acid transporter n=2 Tax=Entamoeba nuttalli TaxID=412467 RepID=K2G5B1_ENTNP|nr:hypothetical protein ENU1_194400 [Entamoeba nuttalli P19]EKE37516.1 hypothetical protein ENU1_194400 [Entamoeba nuttalli P19]|eukprot:XP_008860142.1 hypothetical protein ENU1_194400 [Entamoeba nuttalli P19]